MPASRANLLARKYWGGGPINLGKKGRGGGGGGEKCPIHCPYRLEGFGEKVGKKAQYMAHSFLTGLVKKWSKMPNKS
jgi:hypothetical protein